MSYETDTTTVHRNHDGGIDYEDAYAFDDWVRKNGAIIRGAISKIHEEKPHMRKFHGTRIGPLVYFVYARRHLYI